VAVRLRWLRFDVTPVTLRKLAGAMEKNAYGPSASTGFQLENVRRESLSGRYIERFDVVDKVADPFGASIEISRVEFKSTRFVVRTSHPGLELIDPPRSAQSCLTRIGEFIDFDTPISAEDVPLSRWLSELEHRLGRALVSGAIISEIALSAEVFSRVEVKGRSDVRRYFKQLAGGSSYVVEQMTLSFGKQPENTAIVLARNARAAIDAGNVSDVIRPLREALAAVGAQD
jgi:hypothetical protein